MTRNIWEQLPVDTFDWAGDAVTHWAKRLPHNIAVSDPRHELSYSRFEEAIEELVTLFRFNKARPGDRIAIITENCVLTALAITAAQRLRAWAVPINARLSTREMDTILRHCRPRLIISTDWVSQNACDHVARFNKIGSAEAVTRWGGSLSSFDDPGAPEGSFDSPADQVAALIYTTGTTGSPKGVMLTHRNLMFIAGRSSIMRRTGAHDRVYAILPFSHVYGLASSFNGTVYQGGRVDLASRFDTSAIAESLANDAITIFQGVPQMYARLMALADERGGQLPAPQLRMLTSGGAPLDLALKQRVEKCWGLPLNNGYGITETAPTISNTRIDEPVDDVSTGPPIDNIEVRIARSDGSEAEIGEVGEIQTRGSHVMRGYYRDPEGTTETMTADNFFRTGDLGRLDERGYLFVDGRLKELIIRSGFNVYPPEVEGVLAEIEGVAFAAVIGISEKDGNEEVIAFLQPDKNTDLNIEEITRYAAKRLAPYKRPSQYRIMETLPAAATGKILKHKLKDFL